MEKQEEEHPDPLDGQGVFGENSLGSNIAEPSASQEDG